jgi:hypothetical protein
MPEEYQIHLNFLPITGEVPPFRIYRKQRQQQDTRPSSDVRSYSLPVSLCDEQKRAPYWVQASPADGFEQFQVQPASNHELTRWILYLTLCESVRRHLQPADFHIPEHGFYDEVSLVMQRHEEGEELLVVQPYFLRATRAFGCLTDFHFRLCAGIPFSRTVQQLCLSLDKNFKRNLDYYVDRSSRIRKFVNERKEILASLLMPGATQTVSLGDDFVALSANRLNSKVYIFAGGKEARSQFTGLRDFGPLTPLESPAKLLFVFREQERVAARKLAMTLRGSAQRERFSFPGFHSLFKTDIQIDSSPVVLADLSQQSFNSALQRVKVERKTNANTVPILIVPDDNEATYLAYKAVFAHEGIPTQVCTSPIIQDENALRWSIANIALQLFCKSGGQPWKVRPTSERSLIIGISQSHKIWFTDERPTVEKYFAFSVMTDSSGLFQRIQVLGEGERLSAYLHQLRMNLHQIISDSTETFSNVVIHTSFKLKHREMDAIYETVRQASGECDPARCQFAVVKVNHKSRFFGINRDVNSLVPYEATRVKLGRGEYLVWFEGIFPDRPTVSKAFPGPTHLEFMRITDENRISDEILLQDLVNLSGANWRGFNAKSAPVSVFYCHLVADFVHDFHERGLPLPLISDLRPWFL